MNFWTDPTNFVLAAFAAGSGALLAWPKLIRGSGANGIGTLEVTQLINSRNALILDVREPDEFSNGSITGARNIASGAVAARISEIAKFKARPVIVVCQSGQRSAKAAAELLKSGFTEVYSLSGGINAWLNAGLPVVAGKAPATKGARQSTLPGKRDAARQLEAPQEPRQQETRQQPHKEQAKDAASRT